MGQFEYIIIIIILIKRCSLTRVKITALYKHLMTKTMLTYISNKQNLKYIDIHTSDTQVSFASVSQRLKLPGHFARLSILQLILLVYVNVVTCRRVSRSHLLLNTYFNFLGLCECSNVPYNPWVTSVAKCLHLLLSLRVTSIAIPNAQGFFAWPSVLKLITSAYLNIAACLLSAYIYCSVLELRLLVLLKPRAICIALSLQIKRQSRVACSLP